MKILMVATEAAPFLRTGDVATVVTGLSLELRRQGHDVRIVIPRYRNLVLEPKPRLIISEDKIQVPLGDYTRGASVWRIDTDLPIYLIGNDFSFDRKDPYGYLDDYERFIFFTRAVLEVLIHPDFAAEMWQPDVIHGHDWFCGLMPFWLKHTYVAQPQLVNKAFVYTIHNAGFQGQFSYRALNVARLASLGIYTSIGESDNEINFLARGVLAADAVNTVSPTHAEELRAGRYAENLLPALRSRPTKLVGILNGLDYSIYDPAFDEKIESPFGRSRLQQRAKNKAALQAECGFEVNPTTPILGMVSRLITEKGAGLLETVLPAILEADAVQIVIIGSVGDYRYREIFSHIQHRFSKQMAVFFMQDDVRANRVFAGADIILVPSQHEPCGLQQMIAMRYGAVPLVHRTGGLTDTVIPINAELASTGDPAPYGASTNQGQTPSGEGFTFDKFDAPSLLLSIRTALKQYRSSQHQWQLLQHDNMAVDFSWKHPTQQYVTLYQEALLARQSNADLSKGSASKPDPRDLLMDAVLEAGELAMTIERDTQLKRIARSVRELLECDAVLIWIMDDTQPQQFVLAEDSFARDGKGPSPQLDKSKYKLFLEQDSRSLQLINRLVAKQSSTQSWPGALGDLALARNWSHQLTVPINTHGTVLGRIDAFASLQQFSEWHTKALSTFAHVIAINLERIRQSEQADRLLEADRTMARAQRFDEILRIALNSAVSLVHADAGFLYLTEDSRLSLKLAITSDRQPELDSVVFGSQAVTYISQTVAKQVLKERQTLYLPDLSASFKQRDKQADFQSWLAIPLADHEQAEIFGILELSKREPAAFAREDEEILERLALQMTNTLQTAQQRERRDQSRVDQLRKLAASLIGDDFKQLLDRIVKTTTEVLDAQASSLYLFNPGTMLLEIQAATGYHEPLLAVKASYAMGEGTTGWTAQSGRVFKADSEEELRAKTPLLGKYKHLLEHGEPNAFLAIPLKIAERSPSGERVIGVLKIERWNLGVPHSQVIFQDADIHIGEMMSAVIAAVIHNSAASNDQLERLSGNLGELSTALAGGQEMRDLVDRVVETMARVLGAEASSLYLIDEETKLVIQAATGYQHALVGKHATYTLGEGITGWIALKGERFRANNLDELHNHPAWKGKQNPGQEGREPRSFLGLPLKVKDRSSDKEKVIGVLKVEDIVPSEHHPEGIFTEQDELLVTMMANVIATVVYNTQVSNAQLRKLSSNLGELSTALAGGQEMRDLVDRVVETMARVLGAEASSLYLIDEETRKLAIQAATGYQHALVGKHATYTLGEGITGWIALKGERFRANNLDELHNHPAWKGKQNPGQEGREPRSFLGLPLKVVDRYTVKKEKVIGVLKVEDIVPSEHHPEGIFTEQDELLVTMMANVIATVVYNTQVSNTQLRKLSNNLGELSTALSGGQEMRDLVDRVVETMARVLGAKASSLYLIDEATRELVIQAATGYQRGLVEQRATYTLGEGITGWIALKGERFRANNLDELHNHPAWKGKQNPGQRNLEPNSFLGLPLKVKDRSSDKEKVIGVLKVEDIVPSENHPEQFFTEQDELLVTMMANVIATVIHNIRQGDAQIGNIARQLGILSAPINATPDLLRSFACSSEGGMIDQLAIAIAATLDKHPEQTEAEMRALFEVNANVDLYLRIVTRSKNAKVRWKARLFHSMMSTNPHFENWEQVIELARPWLSLKDSNSPHDFTDAARHFSERIADSIQADIIEEGVNTKSSWFGVVLETRKVFGDHIEGIPILFQRQGAFDDDNLDRMLSFAQRGFKRPYQVLMLVIWDFDLLHEQIKQMQHRMRIHAIDIVIANVVDILNILESPKPIDAFSSLVFRQVTTTSPFVIVGAVPDAMFFGRELELSDIIRYLGLGRSCAIIGGRRIGKSSVLARLHRVRLPENGFRTLYFDCSNMLTHEGFLSTNTCDGSWRPDVPPEVPVQLEGLIANPPTDKPLVLLLDEADKLVPNDQANQWRLFNILRELINSGRGQIVFSGERTLHEAMRDPSSPLFNFANEILLGPLDERAVDLLVTRPIKQLGVELDNEKEIAHKIYAFTSGHPNVVQRLCRRLIARVNERNSHRITPDDVDAVIGNPKFQEEDFLTTYWERATPLEQMITLLMSQETKPHRLEYILELFARYNLNPEPELVKNALDRLVDLRSILQRSQAGYEFAVKAFPRVLANTTTAEDLLIVLKSQYLKNPREIIE